MGHERVFLFLFDIHLALTLLRFLPLFVLMKLSLAGITLMVDIVPYIGLSRPRRSRLSHRHPITLRFCGYPPPLVTREAVAEECFPQSRF